MNPLIVNVNQFLSLLVIGSQIALVVSVFLFFFDKKQTNPFFKLIKKHYLIFSLIVSLTAMIGSLFYSEVAGFEPCKLCWYERILMYPQVFLFATAIYLKEKVILPYSLVLSVTGAGIALYHYLQQIGAISPLPCSALGYSVSCSQRFVMTYGYITIPMMALTAFLLLILFSLVARKKDKK